MEEHNEQLTSVTSFKIAGEYFSFETMKIRHILEYTEPTKVPLSKDYILGVINNHGNMVPVVDLSSMFGIANNETHPEASIVIISVDDADNDSLIGFLVDEVDEVFDYTNEQWSKDVVMQIETSVQKTLNGTIKINDKFIYTVSVEDLAKVIEN
ncbi:MAG: purine-binding chemotaxis protein CheW [Marinilabiliaceae bacterium]|nr:purine-binding chemotaxis protein CheW [Marinilabiliaceae bacterium]